MKVKGITQILAMLFAVMLCITGCKGEEKLTVAEISSTLCELCLQGKETYEVSKADIENRFNFDGNILDECSIKLCDNDQEFLMVAVFTLKEDADKTQIIILMGSIFENPISSTLHLLVLPENSSILFFP